MGDPVPNVTAAAKGVINTVTGGVNPGYGFSPTAPNPGNVNTTVTPKKLSFGCAPTYLISIPGFLRILNIALGAISLGLWLPGYEHEFLGDRVNLQNGDTERGYGNGWKREPLNQFVLAAIVICLIASIILLIGLVVVKQATVDWNRLNKMVHLALAAFLFIASICAIFGVWYFNENCCHVSMDFEGSGLTFSIATDEGNYVRHCYCYLTKYLNLGDQYQSSVKETTLYDAIKRPDVSGFDHRWTFAAHDLNPHIAAIFIIFINSIFYFLGFVFSRAK